MDATDFLAARNQLGLSRTALAEAMGVDRSTLYRWESGQVAVPGPVDRLLRRMLEDQAGSQPQTIERQAGEAGDGERDDRAERQPAGDGERDQQKPKAA